MTALPVIPWIGGKRRLASHILPMFPGHSCYIEPFAGAAALFFLKEPVKSEVLNDVNGDLCNLYRVVKYHLHEFVNHFRWTLASREHWNHLQITPVETLTDIQRAARFFFLQRQAFGGRVEGRTFGTTTTGKPNLNLLRIEEELSAAHLRLAEVTIERLDWSDCVERYDRPFSLFFMDPPYWQTEGYGVPFELCQYERMAEAMRTIKGKAIVTVNDVPDMRTAFAGLPFKRVRISYSVGRNQKSKAERHELIVRNWK